MSIKVGTTALKIITVKNISVNKPVIVYYMEDERHEAETTLAPGKSATVAVTAAQLAAITALALPTGPLAITQSVASIESAMSGDMVFVISPATYGTSAAAAAAAATTRKVTITLKNAAGDVHTWCTKKLAVTIGDDSVAGTATIASTTPTMTKGVCEVVVSYDAAEWAEGEKATLTLTNDTILGYTVTGGTSVDTFVA